MRPCRRLASVCGALLALAWVALDGSAQDCGAGADGTRCRLGLRGAEATLSGFALAAAAGNPWMGSASTLGFRTQTAPRIGIQARSGFARVDVPGRGSANEGATLVALTAGMAMGILDGFSPGATVGGVGSVDVVGDVGAVLTPGGAGYTSSAPFTWSLGARIGLFRESFNVPGVTASIAYRRIGTVAFERGAALTREAGFSWEGGSAWTLRALAGKRVAGIGLSGGIGWDDTSADAVIVSRTDAGPVRTTSTSIDADRLHAFVGASWISLIVSLSGELGWQFAGAGDTALGGRDPAGGGRPFLAFSTRLTF